jgi:hypothetical protein
MASESIITAPTAEVQPGRLYFAGRVDWLPWLAVTAIFLSASLLRAPIPAVNEPHYLGKAKHWWDPSWCPGDFFLDSSNPHLYFYIAVGWLTKFLTLPQTALVLRVMSLGCLASGWMACLRRMYRSPWSAVLAAGVFTSLMAVGNFSGEWLIGGVESKVFAYACVLWGGAFALDGRRAGAAVMFVAAVAFHPVVGMWVLIAAAPAGVMWRVLGRMHGLAVTAQHSGGVQTLPLAPTLGERGGRETPLPPREGLGEGLAVPRTLSPPTECRDFEGTTEAAPVGEPRWVALLVLIVGTGLAAAPALPLVIGADLAVARRADVLLLTQRVGHHTDPVLFPVSAYIYYGAMLAVWGVCVTANRLRPRGGDDHHGHARSAVNWFIAASLAIASVGLLVGWCPQFTSVDWQHPWRLWLLKFYPFRLADLLVPFGVALEVVWIVEQLWLCKTDDGVRRWPMLMFTIAAWVTALLLPAPDANPSGMTAAEYEQWIEICDWLESHTAPEALIGTANKDWAIKWFANRPEYVSFKDCPQDAAGILEWWRRRQMLVQWSRRAKVDGGLSASDLADLHASTGMDYLVVTTYGPFEVEPVQVHGPFRVYRVSGE